MKKIKNLIVVSFLIISISCNKENDVPDITSSWEYNYETLGDEFVCIAILQNNSMEGQVDENEWINAAMSGDKAILRFPVSQFVPDENIINVRSILGDNKGNITSKSIYKNSYNFSDTGTTLFNIAIRTEGNIVNDAIVQIRNAKGSENWNDDELIYIIPDNNGSIQVSKMVGIAQFSIFSDEYIWYSSWAEDTLNHTANLIKPITGTEVYGSFLIRTDNGEVPITEAHGDIAGIGVEYPDQKIYISVCYLRYYGDNEGFGNYNQTTGKYQATRVGSGIYNSIYNILTPWGWHGIRSGNYTVDAGQKKEINVIAETRKGTLEGNISDVDGPIESCNIRIYQEIIWLGNTNRIQSYLFQTDENGSFSMEALYGDYKLLISRDNNNLYNDEDAEKVVEFSLNSTQFDIGNISLN